MGERLERWTHRGMERRKFGMVEGFKGWKLERVEE
jgi:hypothetical protein